MQRYRDGFFEHAYLIEDDKGSWVRYEDVQATIAERDAAIARAERVVFRFTAVRQKIMEWHDLIESEQDLDDSAGDGISVRDVVLKEMEDAAEYPSALVEACEGGRDGD